MPAPSTSACWCFRGPRFARPRQPSRRTRSWTYAQHPHVPAHQRWQTVRRQCPRPVGARSRRFLRHGPRHLDFERLHRLDESGSFFVTPRQIQPPRPTSVFASGRPEYGVDVRSDHRAGRLLLASGFRHPLRRIRFKDPETGKRLVFPISANTRAVVSGRLKRMSNTGTSTGKGPSTLAQSKAFDIKKLLRICRQPTYQGHRHTHKARKNHP